MRSFSSRSIRRSTGSAPSTLQTAPRFPPMSAPTGVSMASTCRATSAHSRNGKGPKTMTIGPPIYLHRPLYQYAYESLRWFDHWLKRIDTGMLDEPPIHLFIEGTGRWKTAETWLLPETRWTPFYLHFNGLLSEHEYWPNEGLTTYEDSPFRRGEVQFWTPKMVEATELCGPVVLNLYGSTTDSDVLWFVSILHRDAAGKERLLTRGWLRGSQRALDEARSKPWRPYHKHDKREPLKPA